MKQESVDVKLARIEGRCDQILATLAAFDELAEDHEERIRALEIKPTVTTKMLAGWVLLATAVASVVPFATGQSTHHWGH